MVCDELAELCVQCLFDSDCGAGERCDARSCVDAVACESSADCEGVDGTEACDTISGQCAECVSASDCAGTADCVNHQCRLYVECSDSLDCPTQQVCNASTARCVQCVIDNDCADGLTCVSNSCRRSCSSDNDCTALGQLCDFNYGACARCVTDADCPDAYNCSVGRCLLDACEQGSGYCQSETSLYVCNASGSAYEYQVCYSDQACVEAEQTSCQDRLCTPNAVECNPEGTALVTCSADGLSIEASTDCTLTDEVCYEAECQALDCVPFNYFCEDNAVRYCYSDGLTSVATDPCTELEFCQADGATAACVDLLCTPDEPACNSNIATTCNAAGDGYVSGGTDCSDSDEFCVDGECQGLVCAPSSYFCEDNVLRYCAYDGLSSSVQLTCSNAELCDVGTLSCIDLLCAPDEPACNSSIATTCNAEGDGYLAGGTDCSESDQFCVNGECQDCNGAILLLGDDSTTGNALMQAALESAGMAVTLINGGVISYAGTPDAAEFGAVVASVGGLYSSSMVQTGQDSIVAAHATGTGYLTNEWASYQHENGRSTSLAPLTLLSYETSTSSTTTFTLTSSGHPIWDGLASSFATTVSVGLTYSQLINSGVKIASCSGCDGGGTYSGAGVAVREGVGGRLVHLAHSGNSGSAFTDTNLLTMFVNAAQWAAGCK
jgi:hypothetical protein